MQVELLGQMTDVYFKTLIDISALPEGKFPLIYTLNGEIWKCQFSYWLANFGYPHFVNPFSILLVWKEITSNWCYTLYFIDY